MISKVSTLFSIFIILTLIFFGIYLAVVKDAGKMKWKLILYLLVSGILIGMVGFLGLIEFTSLPIFIFIAADIWLLAIGILHNMLYDRIISPQTNSLGKILFTMAMVCFGYVLVILSFMLYHGSPFPRLYFLPAFLFIAPTFVIIAFSYFVNIPGKVFKVWDFPTPGTLTDPTDSDMADPIIVNFEISKQCADDRTVFKVKAPTGMDLGKLFYFFINDYNSRNPNNPILIEDSNKKRFKWSFFQVGNIIKGKMHLDPDISISGNKVKENASVICERLSS